MSKQIFVNLPVKDLPKSMEFFGSLGFTFNPQFTDDTAACMVISETIYAMLLTHAKFQQFTPKAIVDASQSTEVLLALSCETPEELAALMDKALTAGATRVNEPQDYGFMLQDGFQDPDGHIWELFYMDMSKLPEAG